MARAVDPVAAPEAGPGAQAEEVYARFEELLTVLDEASAAQRRVLHAVELESDEDLRREARPEAWLRPRDAAAKLQALQARATEEFRRLAVGAGPALYLQKKSGRFETLLTEASRALLPEVVQDLLDCGVDLDVADCTGSTALLYAAEGGVAALLARRGYLRALPAALQAAGLSSFGMVALLIERGADEDAADQDGMNALQRALAGNCDPRVASFLADERGMSAEPLGPVDHMTDTGMAGIHHAAYGGVLGNLELALRTPDSVDRRDVFGRPALHYAAHDAVLMALLAAGADLNARDENGLTYLAASCRGPTRRNRFRPAIAAMLYDHHASLKGLHQEEILAVREAWRDRRFRAWKQDGGRVPHRVLRPWLLFCLGRAEPSGRAEGEQVQQPCELLQRLPHDVMPRIFGFLTGGDVQFQGLLGSRGEGCGSRVRL